MSTQMNSNMKVKEVMLSLDKTPVIAEKVIMKEALEQMSESSLGIACILDIKGSLLGILTDGDIRRKILKIQKPLSALFIDDALDHAILSPVVILQSESLIDAILLMDKKQVWDLPVVDKQNKLVGLLHLHSAVQTLLAID
jgi:DeoR family transcriptional regulator, catabolite repression regulator